MTNSDIKRCSRCILPETYATIKFDNEGVCNVCRQFEKKDDIDWVDREKQLKKILDFQKKEAKKRGSKYDCIVPFGGGKDSTFILYTLKEKYNMTPLTVSFNIQYMSDVGLKNLNNILQILGVDNLCFSPNIKLVRKLSLESLKKNGDWCWYCHAGIYAWSAQMAIKFNIPLMVFGEPASEQTQYHTYDQLVEISEKHFLEVATEGIGPKDFVSKDISLKDLQPFIYPSVDEIRKVGLRQIFLGSYIKWNTYNQVKFIKEKLGWKGANVEGSFIDYDKVDCKFVSIRDYLKFIKRNYGRSCQLGSIEIRNSRLTRDRALKLALEYDGKRPKFLDSFLKEIGISEEEFMNIATKHIVKT